jgi:hypothetical protein
MNRPMYDDALIDMLNLSRDDLIELLNDIEVHAKAFKESKGDSEILEKLRIEHLVVARRLRAFDKAMPATNQRLPEAVAANTAAPPQCGERILLLILGTKKERVNIPGDLEEEYRGIVAKHGARYAKLWYYKQVAASAWLMIRTAIGWGLLASIGAWIRRLI